MVLLWGKTMHFLHNSFDLSYAKTKNKYEKYSKDMANETGHAKC
jgi:hypothetical protein